MLLPQTIAATRFPRSTFARRSEQGCSRGRTGGFDCEFRVAQQEAHRRAQFVIAHAHQLIDVAATEFERDRQRVGSTKTIGDRRDAFDRARFSGSEAAIHAVSAEGLDADDFAARREQLHRRCNAGTQPASAYRNDHGLQLWHLLAQLQSQRGRTERRRAALERMDERAAFFGRDPLDHGKARVRIRREYDLRAIGAAQRDP